MEEQNNSKNTESEKTAKKSSSKSFDRIVTIILLGICAALAAGIFTKFSASMGKTAQGDGPMAGKAGMGMPGASQPTVNLINVSVDTAVIGTYEKVTTLDGNVEMTSKTISVVPPVAGKIVQLNVAEHQQVTEGQLLGYVDASKPGSFYKPSAINSPITGTIDTVNVIVGSEVTAATALMTIAQPSSLKITTVLPERYVGSVAVGMKAEFTSVAYPGTVFTGHISYIDEELNASNRTLPIDIEIDDQSLLKAGMYAEIHLVTEHRENVLLIDSDAIESYVGEKVVYVVSDGTAQRRTVQTGSDNGEKTIILSGLEAGEVVVTAGSVTDGSKVKVLN